MKSDDYINCASCKDKFICPHAARGNWCGTKNGETRPDFGRKERKKEREIWANQQTNGKESEGAE